MQKIIPHLWFDTQAREAAEFYTSIFPDSRITDSHVIKDTPSGDCDIMSFELWGHSFMAISAGPIFQLNPSISFMVNFDPSRDADAAAKLDKLWNALSEGGEALMPLGEYPFSKRYGWIKDKYGVSWQLILTNPDGEPRPTIMPALLFTQDACGKAEAAADYYLSVFKNAKRGTTARYGAGMEPDKEGTIMFSDFTLNDQWFVAMDSAHDHKFTFNEAVSFIINCDSQEEIDYYWKALSAVPESEQCGWVKDQFGISWQITPSNMNELMKGATPEETQRKTQAMLSMKKIDIEALRSA